VLLAVAAFVTAPLQTDTALQTPFNPHEDLGFVSRQPPEVTAPTGILNTVYKTARPAVLRIEVRSAGVFVPFVEGIGTGFFISPQGQVLTAYHVVEQVRGDLIGVDAADMSMRSGYSLSMPTLMLPSYKPTLTNLLLIYPSTTTTCG